MDRATPTPTPPGPPARPAGSGAGDGAGRTRGSGDPSVVTLVFVTAWAASIVVHRVAFSEILATPLGALSALTAGAAAVAPRSARRFALALACSVAVAAAHVPDIPNHLVLESLVNLAMLVVLAPAVRRGSAPSDTVTSIVRPAVVVLYAWATVHKLNTDFLDPAVSCASVFTADVGERFGGLPTPHVARSAAPYLTLLLEGGLPVLLVVRRLRWLAVVVGGAFHLLLILHPISGVYSFSALMLASYAAFLAPRWAAPLVAAAGRLPALGRHGRTVLAFGGIAGAVVVARGTDGRVLERGGMVALLALGGVAWSLVARAAVRHRGDASPTARPVGTPATLVAVLLVANGAMPYVAVKTQLSFSMFSNLRTEVAGNHLVLPTWHLGPWQDDLVRVESTDHEEVEELGGPGTAVPRYELRRVLAAIDVPVRVVYLDEGGVRHEIDEAAGVGLDDPARRPPGFVLRHLVRFRPFETAGAMSCRH